MSKSRTLSFKQYVKKIDRVLADRQNDLDRAYENYLYAKEGAAKGLPSDFDWAAYLANAEHNYRVADQRWAECNVIRANIETHYAEGVAALKKKA
jgi:hypothetical protein